MTALRADSARARKIVLILAAWTAAGLFFGSQLYSLWPVAAGRTISWGRALAVNVPFYYLWALLTPLLIRLARRFPLARGRWGASLAVHVPLSLVVTALQLLAANALLFPADFLPGRGSATAMTDFFRMNYHANVLTYWVVVGIVWAYDVSSGAQQRELVASELKRRLVEAELSALQAQLQPHFVFNTLHAIAALISRDPEAAERMLVDLAEFLRLTLRNARKETVPLREELEFVTRYVRIEETRLLDRLVVELDVAEDTLDAEVPNLILQPLVENAIRHGIAPRAGPGRVEVRARRDHDSLVLEVADDGRGLPPRSPLREGIGLSNARERLRHLYGGAATLALLPLPKGLSVTLTLPFGLASPGVRP
ncbi:MAG TPA: histidine kinase [Thermoanaerobaculia bacterium]|nr:histidine kinase [Thermoanaerobaculia bacterium]